MKYVLTFIISVILAGISLSQWSESDTMGAEQIFGVFIMYIAAPQLITWGVSETIKDIKQSFKR